MTAVEVREAGGRQRRNRRQDVLEAAVRVFHKKGYASASIQDVADEVGVLKGSLYHYIDSKEDLLARIFEDSADHFMELLDEVDGLDERPVERLRSFGRACSLWYLRNIERVAIYTTEWKHLTGSRRREVVRIREAYERRLAGLIAEVKGAGEAAPDLDVNFATYFIFGALNGLPDWYRRRGPDPAERIADAYADQIVNTVVGAAD
ncbi:MAG TPA: TetR/AcrR family transcriptional regulator [Solirubrobacterales bacterium]|nr:TetR/AcrR family transcriptional regulator [Solirubrobacterales bacterium]